MALTMSGSTLTFSDGTITQSAGSTGSVGMYMIAGYYSSTGAVSVSSTVAGSSLYYGGNHPGGMGQQGKNYNGAVGFNPVLVMGGSALSGTWRLLSNSGNGSYSQSGDPYYGYLTYNYIYYSLWVRIA